MSKELSHENEEHHEHHHKETFITKYVFSQDHKMIAKQYLISYTSLSNEVNKL